MDRRLSAAVEWVSLRRGCLRGGPPVDRPGWSPGRPSARAGRRRRVVVTARTAVVHGCSDPAACTPSPGRYGVTRVAGPWRRVSGFRVHVATLPAATSGRSVRWRSPRRRGPSSTWPGGCPTGRAGRPPTARSARSSSGRRSRRGPGRLCVLAGHPPSRPGGPIRRRARRVPAGDLVPGPVRPARSAGADLAGRRRRPAGRLAGAGRLPLARSRDGRGGGRIGSSTASRGDLWRRSSARSGSRRPAMSCAGSPGRRSPASPTATIARVRRALHRQR